MTTAPRAQGPRPAPQQHHGPGPALTPAQHQDVRTVSRSGVFDVEWYEQQRGRSFPTGEAAIRDFVLAGASRGLSPHPLFSHTWVTRHDAGPSDPLRVFVRYLNHAEVARRTSTHPFFDPAELPAEHARADCPLEFFLRSASRETPLPYDPERTGALPGIELGDVLDTARHGLARWTASHGSPPGVEPDPPPTIDASRLTPQPTTTVTFVLVARKSAGELRQVHEHLAGPRAAQSHGRWELLVVDPTGIEDLELVATTLAERDPRVRMLRPHAAGLPSALEAAAEAAQGAVTVFCDARLVWERDFASALTGAIPGEFAMRSADPRGRALFDRPEDAVLPGLAVETRTLRDLMPLDPELEDACGAELVHRVTSASGTIPTLVGEDVAATVSASLPGASAVAPALVATATDTWEAQRHAPATVAGKTTLVVHDVRPQHLLATAREAALFCAERDAEVVLTSSDESWQQHLLLAAGPLFAATLGGVTGPADTGLLLNRAVRRARGERLVIVRSGHRLAGQGSTWDAVLDEVARDGGAVHPIVLDKRDTIVDAGSFYPGASTEPATLLRSVPRAAIGLAPRTRVPGAELPLVVRTEDVLTVGGFDPALDDVWVGNDLVRRLELVLDAPTWLATDVSVRVDGVGSRHRRLDRRAAIDRFHERWPEPSKVPDPLPDWGFMALPDGVSAWSDPSHPDSWGNCTWLSGTRATVRESPGSRRWLVLPRRHGADVHGPAGSLDFASSLAAALRRAGQVAVVHDPRAAAFAVQPDVVLDLDGTASAPVPCGPRTVLWATDDVDHIDPYRARRYDLAFAAAPRWAEQMATRHGVDVRPLLNCTDPEAFRYTPPSPFERSPVTVSVGEHTAWHQRAVHTSLQQVHRLNNQFRVHGPGWGGYVPPRFLGRPVETVEELWELYRRSFYVTVGHRPELRDLGLVSSQVFDVLASGGHLLTDAVDGMDDLFGGHVAVYRNRLELAWAYSQEWICYYPTPEGQERLAREVATKHSFDARAATLVDAVLTGDA